MAVSHRRQLQFWGVGTLVFILLMWLLGDTLLPFFAGAAVAYFLDPIADRLERLGMGRAVATAIIAVATVLFMAVALLLLVPALIDQVGAFITAAPEYFSQFIAFLSERFPEAFEENSPIRTNLAEAQGRIQEGGLTLLNTVLAGSLQLIDFIVFLLVTPVVAFYLLLDWDHMVGRVNAMLPRDHARTIRQLAREIDTALAGFVRGQLLVCLILGTFYAIALTLVGLPFGFLVGMVGGLLTFIPYVGALVGGLLSIGIALATFWGDPFRIILVAGIFQFGQLIEGNVLSPNLVGRSVGLHPVTLILALAVFGRLFGFAGMMVAVPVAAAIGVLTRFALSKYLESPLYIGRPPAEP